MASEHYIKSKYVDHCWDKQIERVLYAHIDNSDDHYTIIDESGKMVLSFYREENNIFEAIEKLVNAHNENGLRDGIEIMTNREISYLKRIK